ncbi:hypothetical protein AOLI_G00321220 [Acnodon oligacanthus]
MRRGPLRVGSRLARLALPPSLAYKMAAAGPLGGGKGRAAKPHQPHQALQPPLRPSRPNGLLVLCVREDV